MASKKKKRSGGGSRGGGFSAASVKSIVRSVANAARGGAKKGKRRGGFKRRSSGGFTLIPSAGQMKTLAINGSIATAGFIATEIGINKLAEKYPEQTWLQAGEWGRIGLKAALGIVGGAFVGKQFGSDKGLWLGAGALVSAGLDAWDKFNEDKPAIRGIGAMEYGGNLPNSFLASQLGPTMPMRQPGVAAITTQPGLAPIYNG